MTKNKILFIDTETGGLNEQRHSLLTIGFVVVEDDQIIDTLEILLKEENYQVEAEAMLINQIDLNQLYLDGMTAQEALLKIRHFIEKHFGNERATVAGHNVYFDIAFLKKFYYEHQESYAKNFHHRTVDTHSIMYFLQETMNLPTSVHSLTTAADYFQLPLEDDARHTALYDATLTAKVYLKLKEYTKNNQH